MTTHQQKYIETLRQRALTQRVVKKACAITDDLRRFPPEAQRRILLAAVVLCGVNPWSHQ